mmetsp:Transcript_39659/g.126727  ORF Transcript_39659/g.126727 Transcript_39659/m.126727 type:complete len:205 (+) Transcript_39659:133-747(+)
MGGDKLMDQIFNLKFTSKQLVRQANKCEKEEKAEKNKVKKAIEKGNIEGAKIYAQNAIRKKTEQLNYLKLGSRLDAVVSRLDTQAKMNVINKSMAGIVKSLEKALSQSNLEQVSMTMEQFEKQFETLDVQSNVVEEAMSSSTSMSTPQDQVEQLMMEVADAHGLEVQLNMPTANTAVPAAPVAAPAQASQESDLSARLAELRAR